MLNASPQITHKSFSWDEKAKIASWTCSIQILRQGKIHRRPYIPLYDTDELAGDNSRSAKMAKRWVYIYTIFFSVLRTSITASFTFLYLYTSFSLFLFLISFHLSCRMLKPFRIGRAKVISALRMCSAFEMAFYECCFCCFFLCQIKMAQFWLLAFFVAPSGHHAKHNITASI